MLGNFMTSPATIKTSKRRNIEGILSIAASTNNVDCFIAIEINLYAYLQRASRKPCNSSMVILRIRKTVMKAVTSCSLYILLKYWSIFL